MNSINALILWFSNHPGVLIGLGASSILIFIISILGISWFVAQIPEDYFLSSKRKPSKWQEHKPILRLSGFIWKKYYRVLPYYRGVINASFTWSRTPYNCDGAIVN